MKRLKEERHETMKTVSKTCAALAAVILAGTSCFGQLIGHWALDGDAVATLGTNGTLMNGATGTTDRFGQANGAIIFDGINDYIRIPGGGGLDGLQTGTITMWVRWDGAAQDQGNATYSLNYGAILARQKDGHWSSNLIFLTGPDPATAKIQFRPYSLSASAATSAASPGDGIWCHLAITFSSGSQKIYLNGVLSATGSLAGMIQPDSNVPLTVGGWTGDGGSYFRGAIDDLRIYNTVLSAAEVEAQFAIVIPEPTTFAAFAGALALLAIARRRISPKAR